MFLRFSKKENINKKVILKLRKNKFLDKNVSAERALQIQLKGVMDPHPHPPSFLKPRLQEAQNPLFKYLNDHGPEGNLDGFRLNSSKI